MAGAVRVDDLGKRFRRYREDRPRSVKEALFRGLRGLGAGETFWALRHVAFDVDAGRMLGVIGDNGAGKSTLVRLIGGIGRPTEGHATTEGHVAGLLDLGAGFHPDLTGRENVFVNGVVAGLTHRMVAERFDAIVDFAELWPFIDSPLRTYSAGMRMRLAFAVATHTDPDVLLIDEVLAVGDRHFTGKCLDRITGFKARGCAIVFVSHDLTKVRDLCDEAVWLRRGQMIARGAPDDVVRSYEQESQTSLHPTAQDRA